MLIAVLGILWSGAAMFVLAWRDPKRLRNLEWNLHSRPVPLPPAMRRGLGVFSLLPGLALAISGLWIPFLIWLGGSCTCGWLLTQALGRS